MATERRVIIAESGGDYNSISAAIAGEKAINNDLVTADEYITMVFEGTNWAAVNENSLTIQSTDFITSPTNNLRLIVEEQYRHNGTPKSGFWAYLPVFRVELNNTFISGMEIDGSNLNYGDALIIQDGSNIIAEKVITVPRANGSSFIIGSDNILRNSICLGLLAYIARWTTPKIESCTVIPPLAILSNDQGTAAIIKNTIVRGGFPVNAFDASSTNNAADDATGGNIPGSNPYPNDVTDADFVDAGNNDFHLQAGSGLNGSGVNLSGDFTDDIDGDLRPGAGAWAIGADEIPGAQPPATKMNPLLFGQDF